MFNLAFSSKSVMALAMSSLLVACGGGGSSSDNSGNQVTQDVEIQFSAQAGDTKIRCEEMLDVTVGTHNTHPAFTDVRVYVSEIALISQDGDAVNVTLIQDGKWQYKNVALLDFENGSGSCDNGNADTNFTIRGTVPEGEYDGIRFTVGVPTELNHFGIDGDSEVSPLDVIGMNWTWQGGHKHLRMDVKGWNIHLGTTGCEVIDENNEMIDCTSSNSNRPQYQFAAFDAAQNKVIFDYQALVYASDISNSGNNVKPGCMSAKDDNECGEVFDRLGLDLTTGQCRGGDCASAQSWIRVE